VRRDTVTRGAAQQIITEETILRHIIGILQDMTEDWDTDFNTPMGPETRLVADLAFESIDVVQFVVAIEEHFRCKGLPFEELLMVDGRYVDEIGVRDTVSFLYQHLNSTGRRKA
jgi:acyl carrier protein